MTGNGAELVNRVGWTFSESILAISSFKALISASFFFIKIRTINSLSKHSSKFRVKLSNSVMKI